MKLFRINDKILMRLDTDKELVRIISRMSIGDKKEVKIERLV